LTEGREGIGANPTSVEGGPHSEEEARVTALVAESAKRTEGAVASLEQIQERVRAAVDTPEMRRLAEGIERALAENRKRFEPLAREVARVQQEMARAFEASGLGERIAEIERGFSASVDSRRAAEVLRKIEEESRLHISPQALERLERESYPFGIPGEEAARARDGERRPAESAGGARPPVLRPVEEHREQANRTVAEHEQEAREMMKAAVEAGLRSVFPPEFVRVAMQRMEGTLAQILAQLEAAGRPASAGPKDAAEMGPVEKAIVLLLDDVTHGRGAGSLRYYARRVRCAPSTLSRKVRGTDGREEDNAFQKVFRSARAAARGREAQERTHDPRTGEAEVVDGHLPARSSHPGARSVELDE
jgi:hypothetical protein